MTLRRQALGLSKQLEFMHLSPVTRAMAALPSLPTDGQPSPPDGKDVIVAAVPQNLPDSGVYDKVHLRPTAEALRAGARISALAWGVVQPPETIFRVSGAGHRPGTAM